MMMTRKEAIKELEFHLERQDLYDDIFLDACRLAIKVLSEPPRPKGRWVSRRYKVLGSMLQGFFCSECGQKGSSRPNFCPNCGADMRKNEQ